jgi:hypothetical protein
MTGRNDEPTIVELCAVPTFKSVARRRPATPKPAPMMPFSQSRLSARDLGILYLLANFGCPQASAAVMHGHGNHKSAETALGLVGQAVNSLQSPLCNRPVGKIK